MAWQVSETWAKNLLENVHFVFCLQEFLFHWLLALLWVPDPFIQCTTYPLHNLSGFQFFWIPHLYNLQQPLADFWMAMLQVYFINHRYDGIQLWELQSAPAVHQLVWLSNFISFLFLYPSTFNLLEVAAVDKPKMHLWETGIMRITRHPQVWYLFDWPFTKQLNETCFLFQ